MNRALILLILVNTVFRETWNQCLSQHNSQTVNNDVDKALETLVNGSVQFGLDMFRLLHYQSESHNSPGLLFSPFSVWSTLMLTFMGAKGQTEQSISNVLGVQEVTKDLSARTYNSLRLRYLASSNRNNTSRLAYKLFFHKEASLRKCMLEYFGANLERVAFRTDPEGSRRYINHWVEEQTNYKIKDLLPPSSVGPETKLVIANAVYFKGTWLKQFDAKFTRNSSFLTGPGQLEPVEMMFVRDIFPYGFSKILDCYAMELPYVRHELSMVILLPRGSYTKGINRLAQLITPGRLNDLLYTMRPRDVILHLPKFHLEDEFELRSLLETLGLGDIFNPTYADLSGFTGHHDITIDTVRHKASVVVNEEGTEAAAATGLLVSRSRRPVGPALFKVNHPFFFYIRDNRIKVILFMGVVKNPPQKFKNR
ncbi:leukocyte elastase inhibitor-like [Tachypleus tridentatus]|uniref:leukocyte elastase inhibitor-like n=1 Tax=Tachypleus tridentatus TaxID=6853 RepID=UPI003FD52E6C